MSAVIEAASVAGRVCPADYVYSPKTFARLQDFEAETLYVVGGLYGNLAALEAVEQLAAQEMTPVTIVFNGDFHWFDAAPDWFAQIEHGVTPHRALRGNVETEIARMTDIGAGCGCDYPANVSDDVVWRSNYMSMQLRTDALAPARTRLRELPMHLVAEVAGLRVGIAHGDANSLAGWNFAHDALDNSSHTQWLTGVRADSHIDVFASTHTCLAALRDFALPSGRLTVINNGAAGMPNFSDSRYGLISRIAGTASPHKPLYGLQRDGVHIDAIPLKYDHEAFLDRFLSRWPPGSPAHDSYYARIADGPDYSVAQARPASR
ncbi:MAG TPA: hypothetical protein VHV58_00290 [Pseudolabrys sp.]|nr:hypothetical protein [Pseudolabrys sp.]